MMAAVETGNEGRRIIRSQSSQRELMIDMVEECMDEWKGQISCRLEYFGAVTSDSMLWFPDLAVGHSARGTLSSSWEEPEACAS